MNRRSRKGDVETIGWFLLYVPLTLFTGVALIALPYSAVNAQIESFGVENGYLINRIAQQGVQRDFITQRVNPFTTKIDHSRIKKLIDDSYRQYAIEIKEGAETSYYSSYNTGDAEGDFMVLHALAHKRYPEVVMAWYVKDVPVTVTLVFDRQYRVGTIK